FNYIRRIDNYICMSYRLPGICSSHSLYIFQSFIFPLFDLSIDCILLLGKEQNAELCDATMLNSSTTARFIKK
ncbi:MAG: hypothetical protein ACKVOW_06755, partial [Chitinophagaceae bacterium]